MVERAWSMPADWMALAISPRWRSALANDGRFANGKPATGSTLRLRLTGKPASTGLLMIAPVRGNVSS